VRLPETQSDPTTLAVGAEVSSLLQRNGLGKYANKLKADGIDGSDLDGIEEETEMERYIEVPIKRKKFMNLLKRCGSLCCMPSDRAAPGTPHQASRTSLTHQHQPNLPPLVQIP
jgi:hypothetical protein